MTKVDGLTLLIVIEIKKYQIRIDYWIIVNRTVKMGSLFDANNVLKCLVKLMY